MGRPEPGRVTKLLLNLLVVAGVGVACIPCVVIVDWLIEGRWNFITLIAAFLQLGLDWFCLMIAGGFAVWGFQTAHRAWTWATRSTPRAQDNLA